MFKQASGFVLNETSDYIQTFWMWNDHTAKVTVRDKHNSEENPKNIEFGFYYSTVFLRAYFKYGVIKHLFTALVIQLTQIIIIDEL